MRRANADFSAFAHGTRMRRRNRPPQGQSIPQHAARPPLVGPHLARVPCAGAAPDRKPAGLQPAPHSRAGTFPQGRRLPWPAGQSPLVAGAALAATTAGVADAFAGGHASTAPPAAPASGNAPCGTGPGAERSGRRPAPPSRVRADQAAMCPSAVDDSDGPTRSGPARHALPRRFPTARR